MSLLLHRVYLGIYIVRPQSQSLVLWGEEPKRPPGPRTVVAAIVPGYDVIEGGDSSSE